MSDNPEYSSIRHRVEQRLKNRKRVVRYALFAANLMLFVLFVAIAWASGTADPLFSQVWHEPGSNLNVLLVLPTIGWAIALILHLATIINESANSQGFLRNRMFKDEIEAQRTRQDMAELGFAGSDGFEKPKRHIQAPAAQNLADVEIGDDGELVPNAASARHGG